MGSPFFKFKNNRIVSIALLMCLLFFISFSVLSTIRHLNYRSFGYDLGINSQTVWRYSKFQLPISTLSPYPERPKLYLHFELIYVLIAPMYWIYNSPITLLIVQNIFLVSGGFALFLLARKRLKRNFLSLTILFSYLIFFGVQFAAWTDVHSTSFAAAFLAWLLYFLDIKRMKWTFVFLVLAITSKENIALYTLLITFFYYIKYKNRIALLYSGISIAYLLFMFLMFFPSVNESQYLYQNSGGLLSNFNPLYLVNTSEKLSTLLYSYGSVGFLALLSPFSLLLTLSHFFTFFVIASDLPGGKNIFGHYHVVLAPLLFWGTILFLEKFKNINRNYAAVYLLICALFMQYYLHLPISYLSKSWFWEKPDAVDNINSLIKYLPHEVAVVAQNNIAPHVAHRDKIYTLYPTEKDGNAWLEWYGDVQYLLVDISEIWDIRHLLIENEKFKEGLANLEKEQVISPTQEIGSAKLFIVNKSL